eukprot:8194214-Alexandrium_andersonii.AAC.1
MREASQSRRPPIPRASHGASCAWQRAKGGEPCCRRFGAEERAVWPVGSAVTAASLGLDFGPRARPRLRVQQH